MWIYIICSRRQRARRGASSDFTTGALQRVRNASILSSHPPQEASPAAATHFWVQKYFLHYYFFFLIIQKNNLKSSRRIDAAWTTNEERDDRCSSLVTCLFIRQLLAGNDSLCSAWLFPGKIPEGTSVSQRGSSFKRVPVYTYSPRGSLPKS